MKHDSEESKAVTELKTRARLRLNAMKASQHADAGDVKLRDCLNAVSKEIGFSDYTHARRVLGGEARPGDDFGTFWYAPRCAGLLNQWFATYEEARAALKSTPRRCFLLPYRRQFMVVEDDFIRELGLQPEDSVWTAAGHDLLQAYGSAAWRTLALGRLKAQQATFAGG